MHTIVAALALLVPTQAPADLAPQVRSLVRELEAPQKSVRDDAERRLIELGPEALTLLPESRPGDSAELGLRLNRVRLAMLRAKAAHSIEASTLTASFKSPQLAEVLAEIERLTGNRVIDYRRQFGQTADDIPVTIEFDRTPFWQAIDKLCAATGLTTYAFGGEDGLALVARTVQNDDSEPAKSHVAYCGAFRMKARRLSASRDLDSGASELRVELESAWEPRLRPLFLTVAARNLSLVDDTGQTLAPLNPDLVLELPPQGRASQVDVDVAVAAPPRTSKSIRTLKGSLSVLLTAEMHTFRFKDLVDRKREEQRSAAVTVTLEPTRMNNALFEVPLRIRYENPVNALESHRAWFYKNPAYLESADGKKSAPGSTELTRQADDEVSLNLMFVDPGDLSKQTFVYQTPADIVALPIEFEFTDLPLP